jgi:sensor histidine kinase YesM
MGRTVALVWALATVVGLLLFGYRYLDDLARGRVGTLMPRLVEELSIVYVAALLFPAVIWVARRWPLDRGHWPERLPIHLLAILLFSLAHTTLDHVARVLLFPLVELGAYEHTITVMRYLVQMPSDALWYALLILLVTLYDRRRVTHVTTGELRAAQLESRLAQAQLQNLRLRLQPHFLFNALNTIAAVMHEDTRAADSMLVKLSALLRHALRAPAAPETTLNEELRELALYVDIMRARFDGQLEVRVEATPEAERALVPPLILQPLVEHAIRHGCDPLTACGVVEVHCTRDQSMLVLEVRDHGAGLPATADAALGESDGLAAVADRLARAYGPAHHFELYDAADGGVRVTVRLPYRVGEGGGE